MDLTPEITELIAGWQRGDRDAENRLFAALYDQIHQIAIYYARSEQGSSMSATDIVHEAYVKLRGSSKLDIRNRTHFLALTARVMKHYMIDRARAYQTERHGGNLDRVVFDESFIRRDEDATEILNVSNAMERLRTEHPRRAEVADLRYFAGYTLEEVGEILGISSKQVGRDWNAARLRLGDLIDGRI